MAGLPFPCIRNGCAREYQSNGRRYPRHLLQGPAMRLFPVVLLAATAFATACGSLGYLTSQTVIEPQKAFLLGGGQPGAFTVTGKNSGPVPVSIFVERGGTRDSITTLLPGAPVEATFPAGAMAVIRNASSSRTAVVDLKVRGDVSQLGMRYESARR